MLGAERAITHPETGDRMGTTRPRKAVLRVSRVCEQLSLARPLAAGGAEIERGDPVVRFGRMSAWFIDVAGNGEGLYAQLRDSLPQLDWRGYWRGYSSAPADESTPHLTFRLEDQRLEVRDPGSQRVRVYSGAPRDRKPAPGEAPARSPSSASVTGPPQERQAAVKDLGVVPDGVRTGDFAHHDGRVLMAAVDDEGLSVYALDGGVHRVARRPVPNRSRALAVHWWLPPGQANPYLAVTMWDGSRADSAVLRLDDGRLHLVERLRGRVAGTVDEDGDGHREALLAQAFDRKDFFGRRVTRLRLDDQDLIEQPAGRALPRGVAVTSATLADLTGDGQSELAQVREDELHIFGPSGERVYTSREGFGGSQAFVTYDVEPELEFSPVKKVQFEHAPVAVDVDGDEAKELVAVAVDRKPFSVPGLESGVRRSQLVIVDFGDDRRFTITRMGAELDAPVLALGAQGERILLLAPESRQFFAAGEGDSRLFAMPWTQ